MDITLSSYDGKIQRIAALDRFRGLSLWLMLAFGAAKMVTFSDFFIQLSSHDLTESFQIIKGYGFYDSIAPMFVFASGLAFWAAFESRRKKVGTSSAILSSAKRAVELIGLGGLLAFDFHDPLGFVLMGSMVAFAIVWIVSIAVPRKTALLRKWMGRTLFILGVILVLGNYVEIALKIGGIDVWNSHWSAIASIGFGLFAVLSIVRLPDWGKIVASILLTILYFLACAYTDAYIFDDFVHGGLAGSFGYALLVLYAFTLMSIRNDIITKLFYALLISGFGIAACFFISPSKEAVNVSYVLVSFAICYDVYAVISLFDGLSTKKFAPLTILGRNSLTVYCLHFLMTFTYGICLNALVAYVPAGEIIQCIMFALGMCAYPLIMAVVVNAFAKRGWLIRL